MSFTGLCPHCREFYASDMGKGFKHAPKCKDHLFCKDICPKGRKKFIGDLAVRIATSLRSVKRADLGASILRLLRSDGR